MVKTYIKTEYRDIAKMLVKALPVENDDFGLKVNEYIDIIKSLPNEAKTALKCAYIFASKAPREEREDLYQSLFLAIWKVKPENEKFAYSIARCDWQDFWKSYKIKQHMTLESITESDDSSPDNLADMIIGYVEYETRYDGKIEAETIWSKIPEDIKPIILKKLSGKALTSGKRKRGRPKVTQPLIGKHRKAYSRWLRKQAYQILPDANRMEGESETACLNRWLKAHGYKLIMDLAE
ncbi:MAG: hypothetical protein JW762_06410 [Dehalococcoidales bacterium]|nr:hypothetical protein [Dehalococcoidales bacterium]